MINNSLTRLKKSPRHSKRAHTAIGRTRRMKTTKQLRLSLFTVPDLSIGRAPLTPQNSQFDPKRLEYLEGMVVYLNGLFENLRQRHPEPEALSRLEKISS